MNFGFAKVGTSIHNLLRFCNGKITRPQKNIYEMGQFILEIAGAFCLLKDQCTFRLSLYSNGIACAPKNVAFMDMIIYIRFMTRSILILRLLLIHNPI
jgi:hypothetical protein